jgi:hypothetical protein
MDNPGPAKVSAAVLCREGKISAIPTFWLASGVQVRKIVKTPSKKVIKKNMPF